MLESDKKTEIAKLGFSQIKRVLILFALAISLPGCQVATQETITQEPAIANDDGDGIAGGDTSDMKMALSMSFIDDSTYRSGNVEGFNKAALKAQEQGLLDEYVVLDAQRSTEKQIEQIEQLIDEGYDAILIDAASVTLLNPVVKSACDVGIVVIGVSNRVSEPCAYNITNLWDDYGAIQATYLGQRLNQGNILEVRGLKGSSADAAISAAIHADLLGFPSLNVVETVYGQWTQKIAQEEVEAVLSSLPNVDAVVTQGGDGYGIARAFEATDRPLPIILLGNRYNELKWWQEQRDANGYQTISAAGTPGITSAAVWMTQQILAGKEVPNLIEVPILIVDETTLDTWLAVTPEDGVADVEYTLEWTVELIDAQVAGEPLPPNPVPEAIPES